MMQAGLKRPRTGRTDCWIMCLITLELYFIWLLERGGAWDLNWRMPGSWQPVL